MRYRFGLDRLLDDVRDFHIAFGHAAPDKPVAHDLKTRCDRSRWIRRECDELELAEDLPAQVDAYLDIIYFAVGGLVNLGIRSANVLWTFVQAANMRKLWDDGKPRNNDEGRVVKPPGWYGPEAEISAELARQAELP